MNLNDLYKKVSAIPIGDFPPSALSGLLHGYISVYSIVRVSPWLEDVYGSQWDIHERIREIAGELADLIQDPSVTLEDRVGHIADLMEAYLTYSDMDFLDIALDAAYPRRVEMRLYYLVEHRRCVGCCVVITILREKRGVRSWRGRLSRRGVRKFSINLLKNHWKIDGIGIGQKNFTRISLGKKNMKR